MRVGEEGGQSKGKNKGFLPDLKRFRTAETKSAVLSLGFNHLNWSEALSNDKVMVLRPSPSECPALTLWSLNCGEVPRVSKAWAMAKGELVRLRSSFLFQPDRSVATTYLSAACESWVW